MEIKNNFGKIYISNIKKSLKCSAELKKQFLNTLIPELYNFELNNPNATYGDYVNEFGTPKAAAEEYMKELNPKQNNKRYIIIIAALVIILITLSTFFMYIYNAMLEADSGYSVITWDLTSEEPVEGFPEGITIE